MAVVGSEPLGGDPHQESKSGLGPHGSARYQEKVIASGESGRFELCPGWDESWRLVIRTRGRFSVHKPPYSRHHFGIRHIPLIHQRSQELEQSVNVSNSISLSSFVSVACRGAGGGIILKLACYCPTS